MNAAFIDQISETGTDVEQKIEGSWVTTDAAPQVFTGWIIFTPHVLLLEMFDYKTKKSKKDDLHSQVNAVAAARVT